MAEFLLVDEAAFVRAVEALRIFQPPNMDKVLRKAVAAGAAAYRAPLKQAASKHIKADPLTGARGADYGEPGGFRDSIRQRRVKADGYGVSAVVGPMGKKAFMRSWVLAGTKDHDISARAQGRRQNVSLRQAVVNVATGRRHVLRFNAGGLFFRQAVHVRGMRADPFVARVGAENHDRSQAAMVRAILRAAKKETG